MEIHCNCLRQHSPERNNTNRDNLVGNCIRKCSGSGWPRAQSHCSTSSASTTNCQVRSYLLLNPSASPFSSTAGEIVSVTHVFIPKNLPAPTPAQQRLVSEGANTRGSTAVLNSSLPWGTQQCPPWKLGYLMDLTRLSLTLKNQECLNHLLLGPYAEHRSTRLNELCYRHPQQLLLKASELRLKLY